MVSKKIQLACVWSAPVFIVLYAIAFVGISGFLPPPSPSLSAEQIASFFAEHRMAIRIGQVLSLVFSTLLFPFFAVISVQIARIEKRLPVLAVIQFGAATLLIVYFQLCSMLWITATFRPELDATAVRMLNDFSWLVFVMVAPGYVFQMLCIALAAFRDTSPDPVWPRWAGYLCLWNALGGLGGAVAVFFKSGPFAWNGLIGIYLPLGAFVIWLGVMTYLMHTGIKRQNPDEQADTTADRHPPVSVS
ncbi:hypothetical protein BOO86_15790 [Mycobacterium sp. CBMA 234]|uniref:hypothetical protein n=1 Tax=Mycolicibacterium sp. CBMA 234 TaxID=1918495 RepID=UPI0012DCFAD1|nr:hypothetical protein [Mycolicibacterium sp. CBMA 234]MUL65938.1 hypothetical protein [Mycolicibacterium sp. CBMA 234]